MAQSRKTAKRKNIIKRPQGQVEKTIPPLLALKPNELSPMAAMQIAISSGVDLDKLEKMLELQKIWEEREAKKAYVEAMAKFKEDPPQIMKDMHVKYTTRAGHTVEYDHATLANVTDAVSKGLSGQGLFASWKTDQPDGQIKVTCTITHKLGHSESTSLQAAPDDSGGKNAIQAVGSSNSYLERYTLLSLTGLATYDQDNDGRGAPAATKDDQKRARAIRADYGKKLLAANTLDEYDKIGKEFAKYHGNFDAFTHHNKVETFRSLFLENRKRLVRIEEDKGKMNAKKIWIEKVKKCTSADEFYSLEDEFCDHPDWENAETRDVINAKGIELEIENYIN